MASSKHKTKTTHFYGCPDKDCQSPEFEKSVKGEAKGTITGSFTPDGEEDLDTTSISLDLDYDIDPSKLTIDPKYRCYNCGNEFDKPKLWLQEEEVSCSHCGGSGRLVCDSCQGNGFEGA